ncbi:thiamine-binding protein [Tsukamurella asaccharolytica]|uniref:Thiamine-binding protein n=1 Tax=Tsukamurella asaccharolytica TaxID=2592067 RepID=A0A5C5RF51_9ACTN|nr:thiamine-binding protein [Tsukamurella asaccharolytica]TWS21164.1 thiamine-binding protein [Tsukamurella asaccharolytica]
MLAAFSISPMGSLDGTGGSADGGVAAAVAEAVAIVRASGLPNETTAMFTTIEGEWDEVMGVIKACVDRLAESAPRVSLVVKCDIRPGRTGQLTAKLERVEQHLRDTAR